MKDLKQQLIEFRLKRAEEEFKMASLASDGELWNSMASRLYYTCYYLTIALFAKHDIKTSTHTGVNSVLGSHFIQQGILDAKWGKLYGQVFKMRQEGDYRDFKVFSKNEVMPLLTEVEEYEKVIKALL